MMALLSMWLLGWLLVPEAAAFPIVNQIIRVGHTVAFDDADNANGNGEEFFKTNTNYAAREAWVELYEEPSHTLAGQGWTDDDGYIQFNSVDKAKQYTLELYGWHDHNINGERQLSVLDASGFIVSALSSAFYPTSTLFTTTTISISFDAAVSGQEWVNSAAIGSWAIRRRPASFPTDSDNGAYYTIVMDDPANCPTPLSTAASYCYPEMAVYIDPTDVLGWARKYIIAHEFGHELQHWALVPSPSADPQDYMYGAGYEAPSDALGCRDYNPTHSFNSYEYQSAAIVEGMANYFAAVVFNNTSENDCRYDSGPSYPWVLGGAVTGAQFSCEGYDPSTGHPLGEDDDGAEYAFGIPAGNYFLFDPPNTATTNLPCSDNTITTNRGIELDWMRFFWDLDNKEDIDLSDIINVWSSTKAAGGTITDPWNWGDSGDTGDMPRYRLNGVFDYYGFGAQWDTWAEANGVVQP